MPSASQRLPHDGVSVSDALVTGTVESSDGTPIGYRRLGSGPPLVVCHGSFAAASDWLPFAQHLAGDHTVYLYDRRGRGSSPLLRSRTAKHRVDGADVELEVDDLSAVMSVAGPDAALLGHSFGGGCALAYAARDGFAGTVIVYEPRHAIDGPVSAGKIPAIRRTLADSGRAEAVRLILESVIGLPSADVAAFEASPLWARMLETVDAFPDELELLDSLAWRPGDLDRITGPVWLLVGETSPILPADREGSLRGVLPGIRRVMLAGQGHFGYATDPAAVAHAVRTCLNEKEAR